MICLTGAEDTVAELGRRLEDGQAPLHEIRLDALERLDDDLFALITRHAAQVLVCCRPRRQGGSFRGSEAERLGLLGRAHDAGARWIDVEGDVEPAALSALEPARLLLSWHDLARVADDLEAQVAKLRARRPGAVKVAVTVSDAAELERLLELRDDGGPPTLLIGMGPAGLLSRSHYPAFGSPWCYVAASAARATAPGQLDRAAAREMGLPASARWPFVALVGGAQVLGSPGQRCYRRLFARRGVELGYLPVPCRSLGATLPLLERLGARGLSVTMPLKAEALELAPADELAHRVGAVNTLCREERGWRGTNTDVAGVREPLRAEGASGRALILGAGGAARAAAVACAELGLGVTLAARRPADAARWLGAAVGGAEAVDWSARAEIAADLLIHATPLCEDDPWPAGASLPALVFDLALGDRRPSALLERARAAGRRTLDPLAMWVAQGAAQTSSFLGRAVAPAELEEALA